MGFFAESLLIEEEAPSRIPKCGVCQLYKTCKSPKMPVSGKGRKGILIVGEAPGEKEDKYGKQFKGRSGKFLEDHLAQFDIDMRQDCWLHNALICRPPDNATPTKEQIGYCHPNLRNAIDELRPTTIITVGLPAVQSVVKGMWKEKAGAMARWAGWRIPSRELNAWICPTFHPSYVMRELDAAKQGTPIDEIFSRHLRKAVTKTKRPYEKVNTLADQITVLTDERKIVKKLKYFLEKGGAIAFDYESCTLKTGGPESRLTSASVCWRGKVTIAFPWVGAKIKEAMRKLLASDCTKIGHNLKHEDRWTHGQNQLTGDGIDSPKWRVSNWVWDTMNVAHILDNRRQVCSLSFQAFVKLGQSDWSHHISRFFRQKNSYKRNKIHEIDLRQLLAYNGLDSLCTYLLADKQRRELGYHTQDWKLK